MTTPRVTVSLGCKINIGDFQNVDLGISIEDSQRSSELSVDDTVNRLYTYIEDKLAAKLDEYVDEMVALTNLHKEKRAKR